jgi:site-specific DNA-methyltransferase (adenine-specific)
MKEHQYKNLKIINADCMDIMKNYNDDYFDLAIIDPPYRDAKDNSPIRGMRTNSSDKDMRSFGDAPRIDFFNELFRVSKNQIIWGGNYFPELWSFNVNKDNRGCKGFIFWYKENPVPNFSDGELAWTSIDKVARCFYYRYYGNLEGKNSASEKIHPTQKPIQLYNWLLKEYAEKEYKIIDTYLGSGSSAIASYYFGVKEFVGIEINKEYYNESIKRIKQQTSQIKLF